MPANGHRQAIPVELLNAAMLALKGLSLLAPVHQFALIPAYRVAAAWGPQWAWGVVFLAIGFWQFWAIRRDRPIVRRWASVAGMLVWLDWGALIAVSSPVTVLAAVSTFVPLAVAQGWAAYRR